MSKFTRSIEVARESVDVEAGTFEAVLFTDGEASDGHILNIRGATVPDSLPLFVNHNADPVSQIGVVRPLRVNAHEIVVRGEVLTEGVGANLEARRDLLVKMQAGHVRALSGRWDADEGDIKARSELPRSHPAFVDKGAQGARARGLYFAKWRALEGSVVGLGADPAAVMRWAEEAESPAVASFWRGMLPEPHLVDDHRIDPLPSRGLETIPLSIEPATDEPDERDWRQVLLEEIEHLTERVLALDERLTAREEAADTGPNEDAGAEEERGEPAETPPAEKWTVKDLVSMFSAALDQQIDQVRQEVRREIRHASGRVT